VGIIGDDSEGIVRRAVADVAAPAGVECDGNRSGEVDTVVDGGTGTGGGGDGGDGGGGGVRPYSMPEFGSIAFDSKRSDGGGNIFSTENDATVLDTQQNDTYFANAEMGE
jgi:hypothetical protein